MIAAALLAASVAAAQTPPQASTPTAVAAAPVGAPSVALLKERFVSSLDDGEKNKALDQIAQTAPISGQDISALFDLFSRFPDTNLRQKVMASLALVPPDSPQLEPIFISYLSQPEPESQLFGINGAFRLRSRHALPLIHKIAERKFAAADASAVAMLSERNAWWTEYEALSALAQWEGEKSLPLLRRKADESPAVARLLGQHFWRKTMPDLAQWAVSDDSADREKSIEASGVPIDPADARATRPAMLAILRNPKADDETRHRLALKVGACSTDSEVEALVAEHDKADDKSRLLWAAAVFAAHSQESVPLLARYAREAPDAVMRDGARAELVDILGEGPAAALLGDKKALQNSRFDRFEMLI